MKSKYPGHVMTFGVATSDSFVMTPFIFPRGFRLNAEQQVPDGGSTSLDREGSNEKILCIATELFIMPHKQLKTVFAEKKFHTFLLICSHVCILCIHPSIYLSIDCY